MSTPDQNTLSALIPGYPADHPQTLAELVAADPDSLTDQTAWALRKQTTEAVRSSERHYIRGPADALRLLRNGYALHPWEGAWVCYALTADRQVMMVPDGKGGVRSLRKATRLLPKKEDLPAFPASAYRGKAKPSWLVLYGGDPSVLEKDHVAAGLATLQRRAPVADICFYSADPDKGVAPTLWSVRAGVGVTSTGGPGGTAVEFPDHDKLTEVRGQ